MPTRSDPARPRDRESLYKPGANPHVAAVIFQRSQVRLLLVLSSTAIGVNTLVLTTSFGTWKDLVPCLLWSLGLGSPIGSKAITSLISLVTNQC